MTAEVIEFDPHKTQICSFCGEPFRTSHTYMVSWDDKKFICTNCMVKCIKLMKEDPNGLYAH